MTKEECMKPGSKTIKIGIVGATGYTGVELLRLLWAHPYADVCVVTSRQEAGRSVADLFPSLRGKYDLLYTEPSEADLLACDLVFFATPHGVAMKQAPGLLAHGVKVIDLSADYRIQDIPLWEKWYKMAHASADTLSHAVYGLPEMNREAIQKAQLVANPGCYPTAVTLALLPLLQAGVIKTSFPLIADCKSGVSGAGRTPAYGQLFCEAGDNFKAYGVAGHRHLPEIKQNIGLFDSNIAAQFIFMPHLTPLIRGMHATIYVTCEQETPVFKILEDYYQDSLFVDVMPEGSCPETRSVRGSNLCRLSVQKVSDNGTYVLMSVIDNLVKGAAGQAVQNMNIMLGIPEDTGLDNVPVLP